MNKTQLAALAERYGKGGHSAFGPSSSHMWLTCAGSLIPNLLLQSEAGEHAAYGTAGHALHEEWLIRGKRPKDWLNRVMLVEDYDWVHPIKMDSDMFEYVRQSIDRCVLLPGEHLTERKVFFSNLTPIPNQGGTMDFAAIDKGTAHVIDLKMGKGVRVYAEENTQAMLYALGLLYEFDHKYNFKHFVLKIHQPRLDHFDEWECSRDQLMEFAGYVKERAKQAWRVDAPRTPDPKACMFCKVKQTCAANARMQIRLMGDQTADAFGEVSAEEVRQFKEDLVDDTIPFAIKTVDPLALTTDELEALKPFKRMVEGFWKTADHELLRRGLSGVPLRKYKVVEGRSNRLFKSPDVAAKRLVASGCSADEVIIKTVVGPVEAERLLVAAGHKRSDLPELLDGLVRKPPGKPTLAPISDRRPALEDTSAAAFADDTSHDDTESE